MDSSQLTPEDSEMMSTDSGATTSSDQTTQTATASGDKVPPTALNLDNPIQPAATDDWRTGIHFAGTIRYGQPGHDGDAMQSFQVITKCPDLHFPAAFLSNFELIHRGHFALGSRAKPWTTPDGASLQDWNDNMRSPRPWTRRDEKAYASFEWWYNDVQDEEVVVGFSGRKQHRMDKWEHLEKKEYDRWMIDFVVKESKEIRELCSDKQILRLQKEWWRRITYKVIALDLEERLGVLRWHFLNPGEVLDELKTMQEDEQRPIVWSEEDRQQDQEANTRAIVRRQKFELESTQEPTSPESPAKKRALDSIEEPALPEHPSKKKRN